MTFKIMIVLALGVFSHYAIAGETMATSETPQPQEYSYSTHLDIAKVISMSTVPDVCEVTSAVMVYEDSQGNQHALKYQTMGNGCSHG